MIPGIGDEVVEVRISHNPQSEQISTDLFLLLWVEQLVAVMLGEVLYVEPVDAHDDGYGQDVELQQPEVADYCSTEMLEVSLDWAAPPICEWRFGVLPAAGTDRLRGVGLAWHRAALVKKGELVIRGVFVGMVTVHRRKGLWHDCDKIIYLSTLGNLLKETL